MTTASLGTKRTPMTVCSKPERRHAPVQGRAAVGRELGGVVVRADVRGNADRRSAQERSSE